MKNNYLVFAFFILFFLMFLVGACSIENSSAQTNNRNENIPAAITKADKPNRNLNERAYNPKTVITDKSLLKNLDCNNQNSFNLVEVENYLEDESLTVKDLNIVIDNKVAIKIELPTGIVKNFGLNSVKKDKNGFQLRTEWGGGLFHYENQFSFKCKENNFYLYKVKNDNFSTTNPDSGSYWEKKETDEIEIKPNLPIEKFVLADYLQ